MSEQTGNDINEISRKPGVTFIDSTTGDGNGPSVGSGESNAGIREPEILTFHPETIRFGTGDGGSFSDSADGLKRTRRGTIDRRTRAGRGSADGGTATAETAGKSALNVADLLVGIHGFLATITELPEFEIDDDEAKTLATAIQEVGKHYAVNFDPKKVAWANLAAAIGKLGWTRVICYRLRKSSENEAKAVASPSATPINQPKQQTKQTATADHTPKQQANGAPTLPSQIWDEPAADNITPGL